MVFDEFLDLLGDEIAEDITLPTMSPRTWSRDITRIEARPFP